VDDIAYLLNGHGGVVQDLFVRQPQDDVVADKQLVIPLPIAAVVARQEVAPSVYFNNDPAIGPDEIYEVGRVADRSNASIKVEQTAKLGVGRKPVGENAFAWARWMRTPENGPNRRCRSFVWLLPSRGWAGFQMAGAIRDGVECGVSSERLWQNDEQSRPGFLCEPLGRTRERA
jgi:hypothetical protein